MKFSVHFGLLPLLGFLLVFDLQAQIIQNDTLKAKLGEVVVTANKINTSNRSVTQKVDVISRDEINTIISGNNNLAELIAKIPGASVSALSRNDANWGTYSGIGPKYSTYMLNGLPIDAFIDPMSIDFMVFERIEVQRGAASVLYPNYLSQDFAGVQSPLAGTVNLVLKENITNSSTQLSTSYGSYNTLNTQLFHQDFTEELNYFAGLNYENSDYTNYGTENSWLNMKKNPAYRKTKLFAGTNYFLNNKSKVGLFINKTFHTGDAGRIYRGFDHDYTIINLNLKSEISDKTYFNVSAGYRNYDRTWQESNFVITDSLISNNGVNQIIVPIDINLAVKTGSNGLFISGIDYQTAKYSTFSDPLLGYNIFGNKSRAYQIGFYAQQEFRLENLTVRGGLRYNHLNIDIDLINGGNAGEPNSKYDNIIWNGGIKYNLLSSMSLYANAGNSFIAPGLKSIGGTINLDDRGVAGFNGQLPNPDLKPESGIGIDFGSEVYLLNNINLSGRLFYIKVDDAIIDNVVSRTPSQSQSINAGSTESKGFELELNHRINNYYSWFANFTYMNTSVANTIDADQDGANVSFAPENVINLGLNIYTPFGLSIIPTANITGKYFDSTSKSSRREFEPGLLINLFMSQHILTDKGFLLDLFFKVYNLTDNKYEMPWQFRNTGLAVSTGLKMLLK